MYSCAKDGKVLDFKYNKMNDFTYAFYIGDIYVGQVFKMNKYWSAVTRTKCHFGPVNGFKNRYYASEFLLRHEGHWNNRG